MKSMTVCALLIIFSVTSFCQQTQPSTSLTGEEYFKKSKNQKTTGLILLSGGVALGAIGIIHALNRNDMTFLYLGVLVGGGMIIASVPFFNASAHNKEKAKNAYVSFKLERIQAAQQSQLRLHSFPTIALKLNF